MRDDGLFVVQLGAFRNADNVSATVAAARRSGVTPTRLSRGDLTLLRAGPFRTRPEAEQVAAMLTRSGVEAIVTTR